MVSMISVRDLDVTFVSAGKQFQAVRQVSFEVAKGETFGIVGESGSGKSTLLRALVGLVPYQAGLLAFDGKAMNHTRSQQDRRLLQYVFQDPFGSLHPRKTVDDALREPLIIQGLSTSDEKITDALVNVGLEPKHRFRFPHQLSGGQRQRVAIARALILNPPILLLDEPTSALDVSIQAEILNLLAKLRSENGTTSVMVSHDLAVVAHLCNRVAVMKGGEFVEVLSSQALRQAEAKAGYTRELIAASQGFVRVEDKADEQVANTGESELCL